MLKPTHIIFHIEVMPLVRLHLFPFKVKKGAAILETFRITRRLIGRPIPFKLMLMQLPWFA